MTLPRFLADECCATALVAALRNQGFDVEYIAKAASGSSDSAVLERAHQDFRIVRALDKGFATLVVRFRLASRGVVLIREPRVFLAAVAERIALRLYATAERLPGAIATVSPRRIRLRALSSTDR